MKPRDSYVLKVKYKNQIKKQNKQNLGEKAIIYEFR